MEKKQNSFVKGAAILGIAGLLVKIIGALFRVPLSNAVGSIGMSYYEVAYPYYSGLLVVASAGLPTAISKLVSERVTVGDYHGAKEIFTSARKLLFFLGIVLSILMFFTAPALARSSGLPEAELSFKAFAPALFFVSLMCAYRGYLQGIQQMTGTAVSQIVEQLGKLAFGLTLAIKLLPRGPHFASMGAIIGVTISELLALFVIIFMYRLKRKSIAIRLKRAPKTKRIGFANISKSLMKIAIPITIGASISSLAGIVDVALIINMLTGLGFTLQESQSAFSLLRTNVTTLINMPSVLTMSLAMSLVPAISASLAKKSFAGVKSSSLLALKLALIIGLPCTVGLFVLAEPVLSLLYSSLSANELALAADLMRTASLGVLFLSLIQTMTGALQGMGKQTVPVFNLFVGFVLKVATMLILMKMEHINIQGAAISTVVCYAYAAIADTAYLVRRCRIQLNFLDVFLKPIVASLAMGTVVYFVKYSQTFIDSQNISTLLSVCAGVMVYGILLFALKMFSKDELKKIPGGGKLARIMYRKDF